MQNGRSKVARLADQMASLLDAAEVQHPLQATRNWLLLAFSQLLTARFQY